MSPAGSGDGSASRGWGWTARAGVLVMSVGVTGLVLLSLRQQRLQAMHELAACRLRQETHDKRLWTVRSELASLVTPERVSLLRDAAPVRAAGAEAAGGSATVSAGPAGGEE